jgi:uncharacterized glyoxalase superfamily protein PhnB
MYSEAPARHGAGRLRQGPQDDSGDNGMSTRPGKEPATIGVECITPILSVASLWASIRYYVQVLGFRVDWGDEEGSEMASVSRDGHSIMVCQGGQGQSGTWLWIGVEDIEPFFEQFRSGGATVRQTPVNRPWAYEMQIEDPDGHVLRFGSEPKPQPPDDGAGKSRGDPVLPR